MKIEATAAPFIVGTASAVLFFLVLAFFVGRGCAPTPQPVESLEIDAEAGEAAIAGTLDEAARAHDEELARVELERAATIASFSMEQRAKYDAIRQQGEDAVSDYIVTFNRSRFRDAGSAQ